MSAVRILTNERPHRTQEALFQSGILSTLRELGGRAETRKIWEPLDRFMRPFLSSHDYEKLESGEVRWKNTARFARNQLKDLGYLKPKPYGVWQMTDTGRAYCIELQKTILQSLIHQQEV